MHLDGIEGGEATGTRELPPAKVTSAESMLKLDRCMATIPDQSPG